MKRGNLVAYDLKGNLLMQTGDAEGDVLDHVVPVGVPYIIIEHGKVKTHRVIEIDVSDENNHFPIFEEIEIKKSYDELTSQVIVDKLKIKELEDQLLLTQGGLL